MAYNVNAVWNNEEAFIMVGTSTAGINENVWKVVGASILNPWGIGGFSQKLHENLTVFHIRGKRLEKYYINDFGYGGWGYPFQGDLYIYGGGTTMRFTGTNFIPVSKSEVLTIQNQFPPEGGLEHSMAAQFKKEGWEANTSMGFLFVNGPYLMRVGNRQLTLNLKQDAAYAPQRIILEGRLGDGTTETLFSNGDCHYRWVSKATYTEAKRKQND